MIQTPILRDNMLRIGIKEFARDAASNAVVLDALLTALNNEVANLSNQLKTFRAQKNTHGTKARANSALLERTLKMLEGKHADYALLLAAVNHAAVSA